MEQKPERGSSEEARLLLPWYITGKLDEQERRFVEHMLARDPSLREEYQREQRMVETIRQNASLLQLTAVDGTTQRLEKLLKRIEREANQSQATPSPPPLTHRHGQTNRHWWQAWQDWLRGAAWFTPANAAFAFLLLLQIGVLVGFALVNDEDAMIYHTVTASNQHEPQPKASGTVLMINFREDANIQQLNHFLERWNARIIDGPAPGNIYKLELRGLPPTDQRSENILQQMQQDQSMVLFVGRDYSNLP